MILFYIITAIFLFLYSLLLLYYKIQWDVHEEVSLDKDFSPSTFVTILIPARNEAANIGHLLKSLLEQDYPKKLMQLIVIDDFSEDNTAEIVNQFPSVEYVHLSASSVERKANSFKKMAISLGVTKAKGDLIITTDADCVMCDRWLKAMVSEYEHGHSVMLAGPVIYKTRNNLFHIFQSLDFMSMQGITAAVLQSKKGLMGNGANLAYEKKVFNEVNGFDDIDHLASGDDMMLMYKVEKAYSGKINYVKSRDAIVFTDSMPTLSAFVHQRIRWASKSKSLKDKRIQWVLFFVLLMNVGLFASLLSVIFYPSFWIYALVLYIIKCIAEYFFLTDIARFFNRQKLLPYLFLLQLWHISYMVFVGILAQFTSYHWKGRKVQ